MIEVSVFVYVYVCVFCVFEGFFEFLNSIMTAHLETFGCLQKTDDLDSFRISLKILHYCCSYFDY